MLGVFGGVVEQVQTDLRQARGICVDGDWLCRQHDIQAMTAFLNQRPAGLNRCLHDNLQIDMFTLELKVAPADAADVEQVVDQPCHGC